MSGIMEFSDIGKDKERKVEGNDTTEGNKTERMIIKLFTMKTCKTQINRRKS